MKIFDKLLNELEQEQGMVGGVSDFYLGLQERILQLTYSLLKMSIGEDDAYEAAEKMMEKYTGSVKELNELSDEDFIALAKPFVEATSGGAERLKMKIGNVADDSKDVYPDTQDEIDLERAKDFRGDRK